MRRNFVLDTNVLLHDPQAISSFPEALVIIPIEVIEEVDSFKRDVSELGRNSRAIARLLDELRDHGRLGEGIPVGRDSLVRVACEPVVSDLSLLAGGGNRVDNRILALALHLRKTAPQNPTVIVTKNVNLRLKADALGIPAQDYEVDRSPEADVYTGWFPADADPEPVSLLEQGRPVRIPDLEGRINEYVLLTDRTDNRHTALGRIGPQGAGDLLPLKSLGRDAVGIRPLNLEQTLTLDALLDDGIGLVTLTGKAGTGKTLLAVAAGLRKVFVEDTFNRLLIFRPTLPVGRDIGFLPGDVDEKMRPWMQPIYDALELIREVDRRNPTKALPPDIMDCEEISIEPLTFIRGRSIPHQYIIIDEAQNLTPLEVKTVITRVGTGTKIVLTGDPGQIDNPYVDALSNGLTYLVGHFRGNRLAAHIGLQKGERSELAETAANLL